MAALHVLYRTKPEDRRSDGRHTVLVDAADEAAARAAVPSVPSTWAHAELAASGSLPGSQTHAWIEGDFLVAGSLDRGGNVVS